MFDPSDLTSILIVIVAALIVIYAISRCIRMVEQTDAWIIEFLGTYRSTWKAGLHLKLPFVEKVAAKVSLKENVVDFEPQTVITRDNVTVKIDTVVFFQVTDAKRFCYGVNDPMSAIENLTATTLRNIIGDLELDQTLTSRESINSRMSVALDEATDAWGIKINRVELKDIEPPQAIRASMEKQMKAERERREAILQAEGEKQSAILVAEGEKQSAVLRAEAAKQAQILAAEADKQAAILKAQGEAQAILEVQKATAEGIEMVKAAGADQAVLTLKSLEALAQVADGQATKIIIPSEIQGLAGLATTAGELFQPTK